MTSEIMLVLLAAQHSVSNRSTSVSQNTQKDMKIVKRNNRKLTLFSRSMYLTWADKYLLKLKKHYWQQAKILKKILRSNN